MENPDNIYLKNLFSILLLFIIMHISYKIHVCYFLAIMRHRHKLQKKESTVDQKSFLP